MNGFCFLQQIEQKKRPKNPKWEKEWEENPENESEYESNGKMERKRWVAEEEIEIEQTNPEIQFKIIQSWTINGTKTKKQTMMKKKKRRREEKGRDRARFAKSSSQLSQLTSMSFGIKKQFI